MMMRKLALRGLAIAAIALLAISSLPSETWARAGGGGSSGSRGSRSYSSPSRSYSTPTPAARPSSQPFSQPQPAAAPAGGMWRSLAGGVAGGLVGGLLGGMLFRSLGFAGGGGGFGGGIGMMDILMLAGIAYLIYWFVRRGRAQRQSAFAAPGSSYAAQAAAEPYGMGGGASATLEAPAASGAEDLARGLGQICQMDTRFDEALFREACIDRFFQIQAAWMRRDLEKLRPLMAEELLATFGAQIEAARAKRQINKLENITVRSSELTEAWQEQGKDYITVRLLANLLDYTVDETTGAVLEGSDSTPVKFEEYWTWVRPVGPNAWRLSAINQA